jgi:3-hydroxybutyryl-CoA dehydrogenase
MKSEKIQIGILGAGTMGAGIARVASTAGHGVVVFDKDNNILSKAKQALENSLAGLVEKNKINNEEAIAIINRISFADQLEDFKNCGLVIEAVIEDLQIKQEVFASVENIVSPDCILASNTSSLSITSVAAACKLQGRFIGIHFFNPAHLMQLVEIIPGLTTDDATTQKASEIIRSWDKLVVLAKDTPGFIVNRLARSYYGEALRIYEEGIADFATIDHIMKEKGGFRMGPFELMDFIGNDVNYAVTRIVWEQFFYDPKYKPSLTQKRLIESKRFGRKSGRGYYNYSGSATGMEPDKNPQLADEVFNRILSMLINDAVEAFYLKIASRDDIDLAMTKGVNYPKGLLKWADEMGCAVVLKNMENLYARYCEDRYRPSVLLRSMSSSLAKFYQ